MKRFLPVALLLLLALLPAVAQESDGALIDAARRGDVAAAQAALTQGAKVDARSTEGWTPLIIAARSGNLELTRLLVEKGADVKARSWSVQGSTVLDFAAENGNIQTLSLLLDHGADPNGRAKNGQTPLSASVLNKHQEATQLLISRGAEVNRFCGKVGDDVLFTFSPTHPDGSPIPPGFLFTPLMEAARRGDVPMMELLLKNGSDLEFKNNAGSTALMEAAWSNQPAAIKFLIGKGANVDCAGTGGDTALMHAASNGWVENIRLLLDSGANPNAAITTTEFDHAIFDFVFRHTNAIQIAQRQNHPEAAALIMAAQKRALQGLGGNPDARPNPRDLEVLKPWHLQQMQWNSEVLDTWREAARLGDAGTQYNLAMLYMRGYFVQPDISYAVYWMRQASDSGDRSAQFQLASFYARGDGEPRDANETPFNLYRKAANAGLPDAQRRLAERYRVGLGTPQDCVLSVRWYRVAARNGDQEAQTILKLVDARGDPIPETKRELARFAVVLGLFVKAVNQRNADAQVQLGELYASGHQVPKDLLEGCAWYSLAATGGSEPAVAMRDKILAGLDNRQKQDVENRRARLLRDPDK